MIYAHIYPYRILADEAFANFTTRKNAYECIAITDKDEHHFMTEERYNRWKYGRTYDMDGIIYHSGYKIADTPQTETSTNSRKHQLTDCAWAAPDAPRTVPLYPMKGGEETDEDNSR